MIKKEPKKRVMTAKQYSKRLILVLLICWMVGGVYGMTICLCQLILTPDSLNTFDSLMVYLAMPFSCGTVAYLLSQALLNNTKIKQNYIPDYDNSVLGDNNINMEGNYNGMD